MKEGTRKEALKDTGGVSLGLLLGWKSFWDTAHTHELSQPQKLGSCALLHSLVSLHFSQTTAVAEPDLKTSAHHK